MFGDIPDTSSLHGIDARRAGLGGADEQQLIALASGVTNIPLAIASSVRFTRMPSTQDSPLKTYLDHLSRGELSYQFSPEAGRAVFYPRVICPFTGSDRLEWRISKGLGTVYATTVVHPAEGKPFNVALIDCDEGFRLMSRVEDIAPEAVRIGQRVRFRVHKPSGDEPYPVFTPVEGA
jgi:uncharacterized OB-fold protein